MHPPVAPATAPPLPLRSTPRQGQPLLLARLQLQLQATLDGVWAMLQVCAQPALDSVWALDGLEVTTHGAFLQKFPRPFLKRNWNGTSRDC